MSSGRNGPPSGTSGGNSSSSRNAGGGSHRNSPGTSKEPVYRGRALETLKAYDKYETAYDKDPDSRDTRTLLIDYLGKLESEGGGGRGGGDRSGDGSRYDERRSGGAGGGGGRSAPAASGGAGGGGGGGVSVDLSKMRNTASYYTAAAFGLEEKGKVGDLKITFTQEPNDDVMRKISEVLNDTLKKEPGALTLERPATWLRKRGINLGPAPVYNVATSEIAQEGVRVETKRWVLILPGEFVSYLNSAETYHQSLSNIKATPTAGVEAVIARLTSAELREALSIYSVKLLTQSGGYRHKRSGSRKTRRASRKRSSRKGRKTRSRN